MTFMHAILSIIAIAGLALALSPTVQSAHAGPQCTCRSINGDIAEGQTACIKTAKGMMLARCERVLNNTSWTMLETPCPVTQREPAGSAWLTAGTSRLILVEK